MVYRSRISIVADILEFARSVRSKSRIVRGCGLSGSQEQGYISNLVESGLLLEGQHRNYVTSERGIEFLRIYDQINKVTDGKLRL